MLDSIEFIIGIYLFVAATVIYFGTKFSRPGYMRTFVFATLLSVFFAMGVIVGHGVGVFPGFLLLGSCLLTEDCTSMYGSTRVMLMYTLVPMLIQWAIVLIISFSVSFLAKQTGFNQSVSIDMSERAIKHRRIIGAVWLFFAAVLILSSGNRIYYTILSVLFIIMGYILIKNLSWSRWLCLPFSVLALLSFPIGTAIGGYYLWYYFTIEKQVKEDTTL